MKRETIHDLNDPAVLRAAGIAGSVPTGRPVASEPSRLTQVRRGKLPGMPRLEREIQQEIKTWIEAHSGIVPAPLVLCQRTDARASMTVGCPDLVVCLPRGRVLWLEVKTESGRLSEAQEVMHADLRDLGHAVFVVRSLAEAIEAVRAGTKDLK